MNTVGSRLTIQQPITYLVVDTQLPPSAYLIDDNVRVGNDPAIASELADKYAPAVGMFDTKLLVHTPTYAYTAIQCGPEKIDEADSLATLTAFSDVAQLFLLGLWLVKDNSANLGTAYLRLDDADGPHFLSQALQMCNLTADCELRVVHFSADEIDRAISFYRHILPAMSGRPPDVGQLSALVDASRVARTLYLVQAARNTNDLLVKIAFYCMCLESLFSTDKEGVTYRVAERTALFIGTDGVDRRRILEDVTKLYGTRSRVVHGEFVKQGQLPDLIERVKRGDGYLRASLTRVLTDPLAHDLFSTKPNEAIIEHFRAQVFDW